MVARRTNEIGVRMALGAPAADVIGMVLRDSLGCSGPGFSWDCRARGQSAGSCERRSSELEPLDPTTTALSFLAL